MDRSVNQKSQKSHLSRKCEEKKTLYRGAANEKENEEEMKYSSRGNGNELQIAAMLELRVRKKSKIFKKKSCLHLLWKILKANVTTKKGNFLLL